VHLSLNEDLLACTCGIGNSRVEMFTLVLMCIMTILQNGYTFGYTR